MMRRMTLSALLILVTLVPATSAVAGDCHAIEGKGFLDFDGGGTVRVVLDGHKIKVPFVGTGFNQTGENTADIFFDFFFPGEVVSVVEHSTSTWIAGPLVEFNSTIEVLSGGSGGWTWSGNANRAGGVAVIKQLAGALCVGNSA